MCDRFPWKFDVQTSYKPSNYVLGLIFVVNIKFPWASSYHTIVPSTEGLYCLNSDQHQISPHHINVLYIQIMRIWQMIIKHELS